MTTTVASQATVNTQLVNLLASRFIQRRGPVAVQTNNGGYMPMRTRNTDDTYTDQNFNRQMLEQHLSDTATYGHYLLDENSVTKLFVIDIDLAATGGTLPTLVLSGAPDEHELAAWERSFTSVADLRAAWHDRANLPARQYLKRQMRQLAAIFTSHISNFAGCDTAAAYSGNKGIHVYGFTGPTPAKTARELAQLMMAVPGYFSLIKGDSFYGDNRPATTETYHNWHFEIYPKQSSLEGKDLGNLIRLPLGRNLHHPQDPTFFIDLTAPLNTLTPVDPVHALTPGNAWRTPAEVSAN